MVLFFAVGEPLFRSMLPVTDLNNMTSSQPSVIVVAAFTAALLAWFCAFWPVRLPESGRYASPEWPRVFVFLYGFVVGIIGAEFAGKSATATVLATCGLCTAVGALLARLRFRERLDRLPPLALWVRRVLFLPMLVFSGMMLEALFVMPGVSRGVLVFRASLLAVIFFWLMLVPLRLFSSAEPFSLRVWLWRSLLFVAAVGANAAIG